MEADKTAQIASENQLRSLMRETIAEFVRSEQAKSEPAYKSELSEERKRREQLERRLNELVEENRRARQDAEMADRNAAIRAELQKLGVAKVDLAFKAVKGDLQRTEDGRIVGKAEGGQEKPMNEYLAEFVRENPEFLPARIPGASGATGAAPVSVAPVAPVTDMDRIKPGMSPDEKEHVRQEILRLASYRTRGL